MLLKVRRLGIRYDVIQVIKDVNLDVEKGTIVTLLGANGAGKSTIVELIPRFYDVERGRVLVDGVDVRDVTLHSLRDQVGIVLQDTFLFSDTVMNNIRFGKPGASDAEVKKAYRKLVSQYHPDKLVSHGLPEEMMEVAKTRVREINTAYDQIKQSRGFK